jgi:aspartyl-tRNA(Asn)/glutamyl-tRNA(Gln) amidotransferase subunit A
MKSYIEFRQDVLNKKITCFEETKTALNNIEIKKNLNSYIEINAKALELAAEADKNFANGKPRKLEGMLVGAKDNISTSDMKMTCASKMLANFQPIFDATIIQKIKAEGGIIIGKTNMDEFAMGSSNETSFFGACKNPANPEYVTGGSSGGSCASVAAGLSHTALGSDTGGSIRQPAAFCGTVGFKPTYGRISRFGLVAFASSLDNLGTLSANIDDTALLFDVISGIDENDSTSANVKAANSFEKINEPLEKKFKVGVLSDDILQKCSPDVLNIYAKKLENLKSLGAEFQTINFDLIDYVVPTYLVLATAEASSNFARLDGIRYGHSSQNYDFNSENSDNSKENLIALNRGEAFGEDVVRRLLAGTFFLSNDNLQKYYFRAKKMRELIKNTFAKIFNEIDFFFLPTTTTTAFKMNAKDNDPISMYLSDFFTISANLSGIPAISIPAGFGENDLPIGMQLQANSWEEEKLVRYSKALLNF